MLSHDVSSSFLSMDSTMRGKRVISDSREKSAYGRVQYLKDNGPFESSPVTMDQWLNHERRLIASLTTGTDFGSPLAAATYERFGSYGHNGSGSSAIRPQSGNGYRHPQGFNGNRQPRSLNGNGPHVGNGVCRN
ncbi:hypothetical protein PVK06_011243 [Gossypium arboreum]|uniref:Uncharacterized protein n=1 Tax=Gossypium arboreum TaxID=29729 RepID=A0ABR0Q972_GOSAR|nr:hypothetical protein PVK06_011243 [Gossypium arboreum]